MENPLIAQAVETFRQVVEPTAERMGITLPCNSEDACRILQRLEYTVDAEWLAMMQEVGSLPRYSLWGVPELSMLAAALEARHRWACNSVSHDYKKSQVRLALERGDSESRLVAVASWYRFDTEMVLAILLHGDQMTREAAYESLRLRLGLVKDELYTDVYRETTAASG